MIPDVELLQSRAAEREQQRRDHQALRECQRDRGNARPNIPLQLLGEQRTEQIDIKHRVESPDKGKENEKVDHCERRPLDRDPGYSCQQGASRHRAQQGESCGISNQRWRYHAAFSSQPWCCGCRPQPDARLVSAPDYIDYCACWRGSHAYKRPSLCRVGANAIRSRATMRIRPLLSSVSSNLNKWV